MTVNKSDFFWGSNYYNHPQLTEDMIHLAQKALNVKLPNLLIELLKTQNGGYTRGYAFPMTERTSWAANHIPLLELFGIITDKSIATTQNILDSPSVSYKCGLPGRQVLLAGDDVRWWITLDYRKGNVPTVRWIDVDYEEDIHIANSFDDFINGLVSFDEFAYDK